MRLRTPVREATLRRWLHTGRPRRIERRLEWDDELERRLDSATSLDASARAAVADLVALPTGWEERTSAEVRGRLATRSTGAIVADLALLGFEFGGVMLASERLDDDADDVDPGVGGTGAGR